MRNEIITKDKINQQCQSGFLDFIKSHESIQINGINVPIINPDNFQRYCLVTPIYDIERVIYELSELGIIKIEFNVICQVCKNLENGDYISIDVYAQNAHGILSNKNDTIIFQVESVFFSEKGK